MKKPLKVTVFVTGLLLINTILFSQPKTMKPTTSNKEGKMEIQGSGFKEYILLVRLPVNYGPDKAKEVREQWNVLLKNGKPMALMLQVLFIQTMANLVTGSEKSVTKEAVVVNNFKLVSNMILRAVNDEAALELSKECPVLAQGGMIEVKEIQPRQKPNQQADSLSLKKQNAVSRNLYAISYSPGEKYDLNKPVYNQDLKEHAFYMKQLQDSNKLLLAGAFTNDDGGMVIIKVTDEDEALEIIKKDPAVLKKIFNYKMNTWDIKFSTINFK